MPLAKEKVFQLAKGMYGRRKKKTNRRQTIVDFLSFPLKTFPRLAWRRRCPGFPLFSSWRSFSLTFSSLFLVFPSFLFSARRCIRLARNRTEKGLLYAYVGRKLKKRDYRTLWITRINAGTRQYQMPYGRFIDGLNKCNIELNRKMLSELSVHEPYSFRSIIDQVREIVKIPYKSYPESGYIASSILSSPAPEFLAKPSWKRQQMNLQRKHNQTVWKLQREEMELKRLENLQKEIENKGKIQQQQQQKQ